MNDYIKNQFQLKTQKSLANLKLTLIYRFSALESAERCITYLLAAVV